MRKKIYQKSISALGAASKLSDESYLTKIMKKDIN